MRPSSFQASVLLGLLAGAIWCPQASAQTNGQGSQERQERFRQAKDPDRLTLLSSVDSEFQQLESDPSLPPAERASRESGLFSRLAGLVGRSSKDPKALNAAADLARKMGRTKEAAGWATAAVKLSPRDPQPLLTRALASHSACDYPSARADAEAALRLDPRNPAAAAMLKLIAGRDACVEGRLGESGQRRAELMADILGAQAGAEARLRGDEARPGAGESAGGGSPGRTYTAQGARAFRDRLAAADRALAAGDYARAYAEASWALSEFPDNPRGVMQRVLALRGQRRFLEAAAEAGRGVGPGKDAPNAWEFRLQRAMMLNEAGRYREALEEAERVLSRRVGEAAAWLVRGLAKEKLGYAREDYLADLRRASELDARYGPLYEEVLARARTASSAGGGPGKAGAAGAAGLLPGWVLVLAAAALAALLTGVLAGRSGRPPPLPPSFVFEGVRPSGAGLATRQSYELGPVIGRGGMGVVYQGYDRDLQRKVAVKEPHEELRKSSSGMEDFLREARTVAGLDHPNIVAIHNVLREGERVLLVFEYVEGRTLHELIQTAEGGRLRPDQTLPILREVCSGLEYAHFRRVLHRDLKPSNIMVTDEGRVKVMDFGIARVAKDTLRTVNATLVGTPDYMAPEIEEGRVGPESDVYSLGVTVYEMLTGRRPFERADGRRAKLEGRFEPLASAAPGLPAALDEFFRQALHPGPQLRLPSPARLLMAYLEALSGQPVKER